MTAHGRDGDAGASLALAVFVLEVVLDGVVVARLYRRLGVEVVREQNAKALGPRVAASPVDHSVPVSTRLSRSSHDVIIILRLKSYLLNYYWGGSVASG